MRLPPLKAGIYRHYKGPLYLVLGYAHDANADNLCDYTETMDRVYRHNRGETDGPTKPTPLGERALVVYIGLQLDGAKSGPRLAVRTVDDFLAYVDPRDGSRVPEAVVEACQGSLRQVEGHGYVPRFQYEGPTYEGNFGKADYEPAPVCIDMACGMQDKIHTTDAHR